ALLRTGQHLGIDAVGAPAMVAAALALGGGRLVVVQAAWAVLGSLAVLGVVALARGLGLPWRAAWLSGALMALAPEPVAQSLLVMTDSPALFWLIGGVLGVVLAREHPRGPWVILAGGGLAAAIATRYVTALVLLPLGLWWWVGRRGRHDT